MIRCHIATVVLTRVCFIKPECLDMAVLSLNHLWQKERLIFDRLMPSNWTHLKILCASLRRLVIILSWKYKHHQTCLIYCSVACLFVWGLSSHWRILPMKGCQFWPMLGTHGHWAVRVLYLATPTVTRGIR